MDVISKELSAFTKQMAEAACPQTVAIFRHDAEQLIGPLPSFLDPADPRPAREQFDANYQHGGGWRPIKGFTCDWKKDGTIHYPGDPPLKPIAGMRHPQGGGDVLRLCLRRRGAAGRNLRNREDGLMTRSSSVTEAMVEAGARAAAEAAGFCWDYCAQEQWRRDMRAGLEAAFRVAMQWRGAKSAKEKTPGGGFGG